jgi:hypothetical protein
MIWRSSFCSVDYKWLQRLIVHILLRDRIQEFVRRIMSFATYFTLVLPRGAPFRAATVFLTLFAVAEAGAQTQQPRDYERGIWYDISGIGKESLGPLHNEVDKLYDQGIRRVHIMVNEEIFQKAINCDCMNENNKEIKYLPYRNLDSDVKADVSQRYHSCLKQEESINKSCSNASNYEFEFDKWGALALDKWGRLDLDKRGRRRSEFYRLDLLIGQLNKKNIDVIITIWPEPNSRYIKSLSHLTNYIASSKRTIYGVELEAEENWSEVFTPDGSKQELDASAHDLIATLKHNLPTVKIGVTAAGRGGFDRGKFLNDALLTNPDVDFISFQAYQDVGWVCNPSKIVDTNSPSNLATKAIKLVSSVDKFNRKDFILGLSAYQLDCSAKPRPPGLNGTVNMYRAAKTSICEAGQHSLGPRAKIMGDAYFSEANIVKQRDVKQREKGKFYANNFLSLCQIDSIKAHCGEPIAADNNSDTSETLLLSQLNRDCPNIISDLTNKIVVTPGQPPAGNREIYIRPRLSQ